MKYMLLFFFNGEAGIRYLTVTGVQTCALPIYPRGTLPPVDADLVARFRARAESMQSTTEEVAAEADVPAAVARYLKEGGFRSEERRVGKECRSRWSPYH